MAPEGLHLISAKKERKKERKKEGTTRKGESDTMGESGAYQTKCCFWAFVGRVWQKNSSKACRRSSTQGEHPVKAVFIEQPSLKAWQPGPTLPTAIRSSSWLPSSKGLSSTHDVAFIVSVKGVTASSRPARPSIL